MEEKNWMELAADKMQMEKVMETNQYTQKYGLTLREEEVKLMLAERKNALREQKRIEFGTGILPQIIYEFCDSAYISQSNYVETMVRLQEIFYLYKNEMLDEISDEELLHFMKEQFETVCYGDLEYLEGTCLVIFAQAIRAGYQGYQQTNGIGEYEAFDKVPRWDRKLYQDALKELCGWEGEQY